jgi:murein DD-endopeptidase MepM/ murein hydrolase activator NlpD
LAHFSGNNNRTGLASIIPVELGNKPAMISGSGKRPPDRRQVSFRWLSGTFLTGITSSLLMGGALYASLDSRKTLTQPPQYYDQSTLKESSRDSKVVQKGDRTIAVLATSSSTTNIMDIPTVTKTGDRNVIRKRPFLLASAPLAIAPKSKLKFPRFNPLTIFSESKDDTIITNSSDLIYGADVESEVTIREVKFPHKDVVFDQKAELSVIEVENIVRRIAPSLADGAISVAAIPFFNASRFTLDARTAALSSFPGITVINANVSELAPTDPGAYADKSFHETVITIRQAQPIQVALESIADDEAIIKSITNALASQLGGSSIKPGYKLRVALETSKNDDTSKIRRVSVYYRGNHRTSIARRDNGQYVYAPEPAPIPAIADKEDPNAYSVVSRKQLPTIYNGIYRAALSQNLSNSLARRLIKIFAFDVDFQTRISPSDTLEAFYSLDAKTRKIAKGSKILYTALTLKGVKRKYYRFRTLDDGVVDYYDEYGKSAKKFLLRKPVPSGKFRSPFGMRRHPITRYRKMHTGVDWSARRGAPILAAGNGVVEKAGWAGGYGKQTILRHANGYKTSYSHQSRIAKSVKPGARVRQGQVIGAIGTTGLSTGPHLHYEVIVNGNKVNPMSIRLPKGRVLKGKTLAAFERERNRIDALFDKKNEPNTRLALN